MAVASVGAVGGALVSQHVYDMQPCPWCVLQRLIFLAIALLCVVAALWNSRGSRLALSLVTLQLAASGMASALWQQLVASKSTSCNLTLADKIVSALGLDGALPWLLEVRANCADAAAPLLGLPYAYWSLALFALLALASLRVMTSPVRRRY
jgi:disulfide bond formation protein DsbB